MFGQHRGQGQGASEDREVSCLALRPFLDNPSPALAPGFLSELNYSEAHLRDSAQRIDWQTFTTLIARAAADWSDEDFVEAGRRFIRGMPAHRFGRLLRPFFSATDLFGWTAGIRGRSSSLFSCGHGYLREASGDRLVYVVALDRGYKPCRGLFLLTQGCMEEAPRMLGLPSADVKMKLESWGALFDVRVPRGGGRLAWLRRVFERAFLLSAADQEVKRAHSALASRFAELEELVARLRESEDSLRRSQERFSKAFNASPAVSLISRMRDGVVLDVNQSLLDATGRPRSDFVGRTGIQIGMWADLDQREAILAELRNTGRCRTVEFPYRHASGETRFAVLSAEAIELSGQACVIWQGLDVTESRRLEQQLRHSQKMEAIGQLAGGVAHDFNNLLTVIVGYGEFLLEELPEGTPVGDAAAEIARAAERASALTGQLLAFGRRQVFRPRLLDLNELIGGMESLLRRSIGENIAVELELDPELGRVTADAGQIEIAVLNLVVNARDAISESGKVTLATRNDRVVPGAGRVEGPTPGQYVVVSVTDDGCGMDPSLRGRILDPFFTTKESGQGTGLGLSTVYGIVSQSGGDLRVDSTFGKGSTFEIWLPREKGKPLELPAPAGSEHSPPARGETILLVEDEYMVRSFAAEVLNRLGYRVLDAADGAQALSVAGAHEGEIAALVTDVLMPELSGVALARQLGDQRPDMKVLYVSGYADDTHSSRAQLPDGATLLHKPYGPSALARTLRSVLDGASD